MKKALLIVLALMTAIMLTACGGNGDAVTTGDVSEDITPAELPVTVATEDVTEVLPEETEVTTEDPAVTTAPESETEATTTTTEATTTAAITTTVDEDEEEVEILWEDGIDRDEFEAMFGIDSDDDLGVSG